MRVTNVFLKYLKAFPYYIYEVFITIFHFIQPIETQINENNSSDVKEFVNYFENKYGKVRPLFSICDYRTCVNKAKSTLNYMLVYLHGDDHEDSDYFCRNTLCNSLFLEFINKSGMLFWGCNINSNEGFCVSKIIREHSYPFIGLVAISTNSRMYLVGRSEGVLTALELIEFISSTIGSNSLGIAFCRAERDERRHNRLLRQEQEEEYAECLKKDQERDNLEIERVKKRIYLKQERDRVLEEQTQRLVQWKTQQNLVRSLLPCEPPQDDSSAHVVLKVKFPCGAMLQRAFYATDSIKLLFYSVFCSDQCPRDFSIFSNFPKKEIICKPLHPEWDQPLITRLPRMEWRDPPDFITDHLTASSTLYVVDNDA